MRFLLLLLSVGLLCQCVQLPHNVAMIRDDFGLNFVNVRVNGHPGVFLVDSGASHTVLDQRFAERCMQNLEDSNLRLAWLGSRNATTKKGIVHELQVGNQYRQLGPYRANVLNLDAINNAPARNRTIRMDGILGADFLIMHEALIDYGGSALKFRNGPPRRL
jgi:hypothetical protein